MDEFFEKRVADLELGDDVKDYGPITARKFAVVIPGLEAPPAQRKHFMFGQDQTATWESWPAHARVDVRRPGKVTVQTWPGSKRHQVLIGDPEKDVIVVGDFMSLDHAEEYAKRLRGSTAERAKALGR